MKLPGCAPPLNSQVSAPPTLKDWLSEGKYALALAPGFFCFYAHIGCLRALEEEGLLDNVSFLSGASAGGLVAGMLAAGLTPSEIGETVFHYKRSDFWDPLGLGGVLKGRAFEKLIDKQLPPDKMLVEDCNIPLGVTGFSISSLTTRAITRGPLAKALRATCTFPLLFQPVPHSEGILIDGGVFDQAGLWCVPDEGENYQRILNVTFGAVSTAVPPSGFPYTGQRGPHALKRGENEGDVPSSTIENGYFPTSKDPKEVTSLLLNGLPRPHPFAMHLGADASEAAYQVTKAALHSKMHVGLEESHWVADTPSHRKGANKCTGLHVELEAARKKSQSISMWATAYTWVLSAHPMHSLYL